MYTCLSAVPLYFMYLSASDFSLHVLKPSPRGVLRSLSSRCQRGTLRHDNAIIRTDTSTARLTVRPLPFDVLRACSTANTAFVWLVGISTLQIMPSQQETHSWGERRDPWTWGNSAVAFRDIRDFQRIAKVAAKHVENIYYDFYSKSHTTAFLE